MAIQSYIVEEGPGRGKGHTSHGNGKGNGHLKHADDAMADGIYTIGVSGINHVNHTTTDQVTPQTTLADGTKMNTEVRAGSITIDAAPAGGGSSHALHLVTDSANGRLRVNDAYDADNQIKLGDLDDLSFDYYIASSDRTNVIPVIRLAIDADGNLATTGDRGELVFEYSYQGLGATTQGSWQSADLAGDDWNAWQRSFGQNRDTFPNIVALSEWADADGFTPAGGLHFDANSIILGWSIALGSGNGTTNVYLDNLTVGGVTMDFVG
jgi:hypothetical protein